MRIDDQNEANPFGSGRGDCLDRCGEPAGIEAFYDSLLREAIELAHGCRHLTTVHGDPLELAASRQLSDFYEELRRWGLLHD